MTEEGSGARVVRNTLANGLGTFSGVAISLILTPFLIHGFGEAAFGVWALALSISFLGGYASLADLGIEGAAARYVAEARSDQDADRLNRVVSTAMAVFSGVALLITPLLVLLAGPLVDLFDVTGDLRDDAVLCFALVAAQLAFELPARVFFAVLEGAQRFTLYQVIEFVRAIAQAALFTTALVLDLGIGALGGGLALSSLVVLALGAWLARRTVPGLSVRPRLVRRDVFRDLMQFGGSLLFIRLTGVIYRQMDKAIIGLAMGTRFVTTYEIANRIHAGAAMVQSVAASALLPAAAYQRAHAEVLRELYLRGSSYATAVSLPVTVAAFIFAEPLVRTWVGKDLTEAAGPTRLFLVYLIFVVTHLVGSAMVVALGRVRFVMLVGAANLVVNLVISLILVDPLGIEGVIIGTLVGQALAWVPLLVHFLREFEVPLRTWARRVVLPNLPGLLAQAAAAAPLLALASLTSNLGVVGLLCLASVGVSVAAYVTVGLPRDDRKTLLATLRRAIGAGTA